MPDKAVARFDPGEPVRESALHGQLSPQRLDFLNGPGCLFVPLNEEAARAIQEVQALRRQLAVERGFPDRLTGIETRYRFVRHGKLLSVEYLLLWALQAT